MTLRAALVPAWLLIAGAQQLEPYGLILTRGTDTIAVERVSRSPTALRAEVFVPGEARLLVTATVDSMGCVREADVQVFPWGTVVGATPLQRVTVRLEADSVLVAASARGVSQSVRRAVPGRRTVIAEQSLAAASLLLECARAHGADSTDLAAVAFPNLRGATIGIRRHGDSVMIAGRDTSWAFVDPSGTMTRLVVGRSGLLARRVSVRELDLIRFAAPDYSAPADAPYRAEQVEVPVAGDVTLAGTLTIPTGWAGPVPAVITISGSGPQDRDSYAPIGNGWRPFRQLADTLGRRGIAVLRLDDRGVGGSTGDYASSTERTVAADIRAALAFLRARPEIRADRLAVLGHSEGARVAMLVGAEEPGLGGVVLLAGAADPRAAMRAQARWLAERGPQASQISPDSMVALVNRQMDSLALSLPREVLRWNAAALAGRITTPVAVFQGATDRQVPADQADSLGALFRRAGNRDVTIRIFAGLNHLFVPDSSGDFLRYHRLESGRVAEALLGTITEWLVARLARR